MVAQARPAQARRAPDGQGRWRWIAGGGLALAVVAGLFYGIWRLAPASAPGYLFGTPDMTAEAGYCLAVARASQAMTRGKVTAGMTGFIDEQATFWLRRLRDRGGGLAGHIAAGEAALGRDLARGVVTDSQHLATATKQCGYRAVELGHRFRAFQ